MIVLALALEREAALACRVTLLAPPNHASFVASFGVAFAPIGVDTLDFLQRFQAGQLGGPELERLSTKMWVDNNDDTWRFCERERPSLLVYHQAIGAGPSIAEKLDIPAIEVSFAPWEPTVEFPVYMAPEQQLLQSRGAEREWIGNMISHVACHEGAAFVHNTRAWVAGRERDMQLAPLPVFGYSEVRRRTLGIPHVLAWSEHVLPLPLDWQPRSLWHAVGYWFLDEAPHDEAEAAFEPSAELAAFLAAGEPPVFVGFGSMVSGENDKVLASVLEATRATGQRCVLSSGWAGLSSDSLPDSVLLVGAVPHSWLFPRMKAVVHHGGAGTTAATVRAGVPSVVVSHIADQFFWGSRLHALGVAAAPMAVGQLSGERLTAALREILDSPTMATQARALAERVRSEDGVARMVHLVRDTMRSSGGIFQGRNGGGWAMPDSWRFDAKAVTEDGTPKVPIDAFWDMVRLKLAEQQPHAAVAYAYEALRQAPEQCTAERYRLVLEGLEKVSPSTDGTGTIAPEERPNAEQVAHVIERIQALSHWW